LVKPVPATRSTLESNVIGAMRIKNHEEMEQARALVLRYGWNATVYQLLNPGMRYWFAADGQAVVGFVLRNGVRVVAGAPVCERELLPQVVAAFEADAAKQRQRVCYFCAAGRLEGLLQSDAAYASVVLGAQPIWNPARWADGLAKHASLRAQLNRARNKGVTISAWQGGDAAGIAALHRVLDEWLASRGMPPLHFLAEAQTLDNILDRRLWVATMGEQIVGFLVASPVPLRNGWLIEQTIRGQEAPNGTTELLIDSAVRALAEEGAEYLTLGLVPLSQQAPLNLEDNPFWMRLMLSWVRAHGRRFYNFDGLDRFKAKFMPHDWEPIWAISRETQFSPRTLYAITSAFCDAPASAFARGLTQALRQESRWLAERAKQKRKQEKASQKSEVKRQK
jgi:phosphatidylglycerol lysyltransferase